MTDQVRTLAKVGIIAVWIFMLLASIAVILSWVLDFVFSHPVMTGVLSLAGLVGIGFVADVNERDN